MNTIEKFYMNIGKFCFKNPDIEHDFFISSNKEKIFLFERGNFKIRIYPYFNRDKISIDLDIDLINKIPANHHKIRELIGFNEHKLNKLDMKAIKLSMPLLIGLENNIESFSVFPTYLREKIDMNPFYGRITNKEVNIKEIRKIIKKYKLENKLGDGN